MRIVDFLDQDLVLTAFDLWDVRKHGSMEPMRVSSFLVGMGLSPVRMSSDVRPDEVRRKPCNHSHGFPQPHLCLHCSGGLWRPTGRAGPHCSDAIPRNQRYAVVQ